MISLSLPIVFPFFLIVLLLDILLLALFVYNADYMSLIFFSILLVPMVLSAAWIIFVMLRRRRIEAHIRKAARKSGGGGRFSLSFTPIEDIGSDEEWDAEGYDWAKDVESLRVPEEGKTKG
ncbi:hypothetical protein RUND412_001445 [Rhizina undulata]